MSAGRQNFQMVLLPDGTVLAAGGGTGDTAINTAEIYNPSTGSWTLTWNMNEARAYFQMVLLGDGNVLAAGPDSTAELYRYQDKTWTLTNSMSTGRESFSMVAFTYLGSAFALADGGSPYDSDSVTATSETYLNLFTLWRSTSPINTARAGQQMILF